MFGAYVRFNYAALRKSSDDQHQHLLLVQWWTIENTVWIWLSTSSQRRILDLWNKVYQDFGKFNSLNYSYRQSVKYESFFVLAFYFDEQYLDMYTYKVETQQRRRWLATFDIAIHNR